MAMASASTKLTEADWLPYKHKIELMIYGERLNNDIILENLKSLRFKANKNQLEAQLKKWGVRRKLPKRKSKAGWLCVGHRVAKRQKQGKESQVVIDGIVHDLRRAAKEINRNQPSSLETIQRGSASPRSPEDMMISVCTPGLVQFESPWPQSLPWLMFQDGFAVSIPSRTTVLTQATDAFFRLLTGSTITGEQDAAYQNAYSSTLKMSQLVAGLRSFMPEAYPDDFTRRAQIIMNRSDHERLEQVIMIVLFQLSNNIHSDEFGNMWPTILGLIQLSGIMGKPLELKPWEENGKINATSTAIAEKLFGIAFQAVSHFDTWQSGTIQNGTRTLIKWLLSSGQDPNVTTSTGRSSPRTVLHAAILYHEADLALTLLDNGADPNFIPSSRSLIAVEEARLPLVVAIDSDDYTQRADLIKVLLRESADPNLSDMSGRTSPLRAAIGRQDLPTVELLIRHGANISQRDVSSDDEVSPADPEKPIVFFTRARTALGCADGLLPESAALLMVEYLLNQLRENSNSNELASTIPVEGLFAAAALGYDGVLTLLLDEGIHVNATSRKNFTALHVAAYYGHSNTCRTLLERGAFIESLCHCVTSPLHLAAFGDHLHVVQLLHEEWGGDINRTICDQVTTHTGPSHMFLPSFCASPVGAAIYNTKIGSTFRYLVLKGATIPPGVAHYAASDLKDFELVSFLIENGQDPNQRDQFGRTLLQAVLTLRGDADGRTKLSCGAMASALLGRGAAVVGGEAVQAILLGNWALAERIRRQDPNCVAQEHPEMTMIHAALLSRKVDIMWKVLERNSEAYDPRALCVATALARGFDNDEMALFVDQLRKNRPPSETSVDTEILAIGFASWYENIPLLELLLEKLPLSQGLSISQLPLPEGQSFEDTDPTIVCVFEPIGIEPTRNIINDVSPLIFALDSPKARSLLLHHGYEGDTETLMSAIKRNDPALIKELLPRQQRPVGRGLLSGAVREGNIEIVKILLEAGEDVDNRNGRGRTPLQAAVLRGDLSILNLVLDNDPDVNASSDFWPPALQMACRKGYLSLAKRLIDRGADIDAISCSSSWPTALEAAAEEGRIDMIQLLLSLGASTTGELRGSYVCAIRSAERGGHYAAAKILRMHRQWTPEDECMDSKAMWDPGTGTFEIDEDAVEEATDWDDDGQVTDLFSGDSSVVEEALDRGGELLEPDSNTAGVSGIDFDGDMNGADIICFGGGVNGVDMTDFDLNRCINGGDLMNYDFS